MGDSISFTIKINGQVMPHDFMVYSIECASQFHHTSTAQITFLCVISPEDNMSTAITDVFKFSNEVIIEAGYDGHNQTIFKGVVSAQRIITNESNNLFLIITCKGKEPVIVTDTVSQNAALTLAYGDNILSIDLSAGKNSTSILPADSLYETTGAVKFQGTSVVEAGSEISVSNIGAPFNKTYLATGITHYIADGNWITEAHLTFKESILP
ncbi:MAG: hypothetical protein V4538_15945 [Bacteroidota bacterium]